MINLSFCRRVPQQADVAALPNVEGRSGEFTRAAARELGSFGIRIKAIAPGLTENNTTVSAGTTPAACLHQLQSDVVTGQTTVVDAGGVIRDCQHFC